MALNIYGPALCLLLVFILYMLWRRTYAIKLSYNWLINVLLLELKSSSQKIELKYPIEEIAFCVYPYYRALWTFWRFGQDALVYDYNVYSYATELMEKELANFILD
jgi:hypothetical protein